MARTSWFTAPLLALHDAGVDYVLVGGLATIAHGHARLTQDVDIVVRLDAENAAKAMSALEAAGYSPRVPVPAAHFADAGRRRTWAVEKHMLVFSMIHSDPTRPIVDLFLNYPIPWEELRGSAVSATIGGVAATLCSIDDLIRIKTEAGREKDLLDVGELSKIRDRNRTGDNNG